MRWMILLLNFLLIGCVSSALSGANVVYKHKYLQDEVSDYYITVKSWNKLKKEFPEQEINHLHLTSFHRIVLLTGQVPSKTTRNAIEQLLRSMPVAKIFNATTVAPPLSTKQQLRDSWITTKVKTKIITSNDIYADKIKVATEDNIVYLIGIVTQQEGNAAVELAKQTEGVAKVVTIFYYMIMPEIS